MPKVLLIGMGTNGMISPQQVQHVMKLAGSQCQVFWINVHVPTRSWERPVNTVLKQAAKQTKNLYIIDWYQYAHQHPEWFFDDQVHTNDLGSKHYSYFIARQILKNTKY
ncbi:hypothetical protein EQ500_13815 [Lactobacillus sp. XV13L]|nr:hypothetical protein [Lactobacillus sp. XV13L]